MEQIVEPTEEEIFQRQLEEAMQLSTQTTTKPNGVKPNGVKPNGAKTNGPKHTVNVSYIPKNWIFRPELNYAERNI